MKLHVVHETRYTYLQPVRTAKHLVHLKPRDTASQTLLQHDMTVSPVVANRHDRLDVWGNTRTFFALQAQHEGLQVVADSLVETTPPAAQPEDGGPAWEAVRERFRYRAGGTWDRAAEFVFPSDYVPRHDNFAAYLRPLLGAGLPVLEVAGALMHAIHTDFRYETESTEVNTPAVEALAQRSGVCQDFAHIMIACLRGAGLPARYVSGYMLTEPPPGQPRLVGSDASHAWVSVYVPPEAGAEAGTAGAWYDFDPTNDRLPGEDYVTLALGRDFGDVSPMRGLLRGGKEHVLDVAVTVEPA